jgi:hypothetical protein
LKIVASRCPLRGGDSLTVAGALLLAATSSPWLAAGSLPRLMFHAEAMAPAFGLPPLGLAFHRGDHGPECESVPETLQGLLGYGLLSLGEGRQVMLTAAGHAAAERLAAEHAGWSRLIGGIVRAVAAGRCRIEADPLYEIFTAGSPNDPAFACGLEEERFNPTVGTLLALRHVSASWLDLWDAIPLYFERLATPRTAAV